MVTANPIHTTDLAIYVGFLIHFLFKKPTLPSVSVLPSSVWASKAHSLLLPAYSAAGYPVCTSRSRACAYHTTRSSMLPAEVAHWLLGLMTLISQKPVGGRKLLTSPRRDTAEAEHSPNKVYILQGKKGSKEKLYNDHECRGAKFKKWVELHFKE